MKIFRIIGISIVFAAVSFSLMGCSEAVEKSSEEQVEVESVEPTEPTEPIEEVEKSGTYQTITPEEALDLLETDDTVVLVDVREQHEYDAGHIPGSVLLPLGTIGEQAELMFPDYNQTILVYCRSGNRSKTASETLIALGYTEVYDLGGIIDWPYEVVTE